MAESSPVYQTSEKPNTRKTKKLTPEQALEILLNAVQDCVETGIEAGLSPYFRPAGESVIIVLANCKLDAGKIVML